MDTVAELETFGGHEPHGVSSWNLTDHLRVVLQMFFMGQPFVTFRVRTIDGFSIRKVSPRFACEVFLEVAVARGKDTCTSDEAPLDVA